MHIVGFTNSICAHRSQEAKHTVNSAVNNYDRWRPYRVECTGSLLTSEVKWHRARLVLGWGTAWEHLWVLPAFAVCSQLLQGPQFKLAWEHPHTALRAPAIRATRTPFIGHVLALISQGLHMQIEHPRAACSHARSCHRSRASWAARPNDKKRRTSPCRSRGIHCQSPLLNPKSSSSPPMRRGAQS